MKIYVKNKNFIPIDYIDKVNNKAQENNSKLIMILLIINIFIIPNSIIRVKNILDNNKPIPVVNIVNENKDINKENIKKILNLISNNINNIKIQNNNGIVEFNSLEEVYKLENDKIFNVNSLKFNSENSFNAEVGLWLKKEFLTF